MNSVKFNGLVEVLENRLRECHSLSDDEFSKCLYGDLASLEHVELENLVAHLFDEHTRLTSVINDVSNLVTCSKKFSLLFE